MTIKSKSTRCMGKVIDRRGKEPWRQCKKHGRLRKNGVVLCAGHVKQRGMG